MGSSAASSTDGARTPAGFGHAEMHKLIQKNPKTVDVTAEAQLARPQNFWGLQVARKQQDPPK